VRLDEASASSPPAGFSRLRAFWQLNLYPDAVEAGGCLVRPGPRVLVGGGGDPERAEAEAVRRARAKLRRYVVANRLNRLGTLTYAGEGCFDPLQLREDVGAFFKNLRPALGGQPFPYAWTSEWHPGGHGLHVHFGVGRYVSLRGASARSALAHARKDEDALPSDWRAEWRAPPRSGTAVCFKVGLQNQWCAPVARQWAPVSGGLERIRAESGLVGKASLNGSVARKRLEQKRP
jgi:hypothetical protein